MFENKWEYAKPESKTKYNPEDKGIYNPWKIRSNTISFEDKWSYESKDNSTIKYKLFEINGNTLS